MIITNSRYALVGYFITSYPTRAHGIIVIYCSMDWSIKVMLGGLKWDTGDGRVGIRAEGDGW